MCHSMREAKAALKVRAGRPVPKPRQIRASVGVLDGRPLDVESSGYGIARAVVPCMRTHTTHPTQHAACGAPSFVLVVSEADFRASTNQCKRCAKVLAARDAGRPVFSGYDDGQGDTGARL